MQDGWSALIKAAEKGHADIVKHLIEAGADVNAQDNVSAGCTYDLGGPCGPCAAPVRPCMRAHYSGTRHRKCG